MTASQIEKNTGLTAREILSPSHLPRDPHLCPIGDLFRFQLGRNIPHTVKVQETDGGRVIEREVNTTLFELHAFGSSYKEAHAMLIRKRSGQ